jgi:hypothetical protein
MRRTSCRRSSAQGLTRHSHNENIDDEDDADEDQAEEML